MRAMTYEMEDALDAAHGPVYRWWPLPSPTHTTDEWRVRQNLTAAFAFDLIREWKKAAPWWRAIRPGGPWPRRRQWMFAAAEAASQSWPRR